MTEHYLTEKHQHSILKVVRRMSSQLNDTQMDIDLPRTTAVEASNPVTVQLQELYEMLHILTDGIETLNKDQEHLMNELLQLQITHPVLAEQLSNIKLSVEETNVFLQGVKHNQDILNQDLASLQEKINDLKYVSYDGTFTSAQRHIIDSFRPDIRSNSFQRPRSDMNTASGLPKFFPLENIQREGNPYVRDDTMFIKIMVDFEDIPKTLLSYALSLNPGLPIHVQHIMIKQEAEQRSQQRSDK
ncbi:unnamed protein product [Rotaria sp. Silwood1]|nr:unnamed protein product [Rotaria sp. Silwood1]